MRPPSRDGREMDRLAAKAGREMGGELLLRPMIIKCLKMPVTLATHKSAVYPFEQEARVKIKRLKNPALALIQSPPRARGRRSVVSFAAENKHCNVGTSSCDPQLA